MVGVPVVIQQALRLKATGAVSLRLFKHPDHQVRKSHLTVGAP